MRPCNSVPALNLVKPRSGVSLARSAISQKKSSLICETVIAPALTASAASALAIGVGESKRLQQGPTMPAVVMDATSDEPCNVFITAAIRNGISTPQMAKVPSKQAFAEHFGHAGLLAEMLQIRRRRKSSAKGRRRAEDAPGPGGIGEADTSSAASGLSS